MTAPLAGNTRKSSDRQAVESRERSEPLI